MKWKRVAAVLILAAVAGGILALTTSKEIPTAEVIVLTAERVEQTVQCGGKIEAAALRKVYADVPCVVGEVRVAEGQHVAMGEVLAQADRTATGQLLAAAGVTLPDKLPITDVCSPVAGTVQTVAVTPGTAVDTTTVCAEIIPDAAVQIGIQIPERSLKRVAVGQRVAIKGVALDADTYTGTLVSIADTARTVSAGTGTRTVVDGVVLLDDGQTDTSLRSGLTVDAAISVNTLDEAIVVPYDVVRQDENGQEYVLTVVGGVVCRRVVYIAEEMASGCLISGGLSAGELVIAHPDRVTEGQAVKTE